MRPGERACVEVGWIKGGDDHDRGRSRGPPTTRNTCSDLAHLDRLTYPRCNREEVRYTTRMPGVGHQHGSVLVIPPRVADESQSTFR